MLAILTLVLWEKRDRNSNWLLSLCLVIPMLLVPQVFEDGENYALCMYDDDETKGESSIYRTNKTESERLAPPGQNVFRTYYYTTYGQHSIQAR